MEITLDNHTIVHATKEATLTHTKLGIINSMINDVLHNPYAEHFAGEEIVKKMKELREALENTPTIFEMIKKS